ncbi:MULTISPECIES: hypothetical protein [Streptomyces]|nr:hypothetical protein [Streptomyces olivochromogenes]MCF3131294.1 hypothetical protein [Streptomyces olivochromogenes]
MRDGTEELREIEMALFGMVPVGLVPTLRLAGADDDEDEDTIVRSID